MERKTQYGLFSPGRFLGYGKIFTILAKACAGLDAQLVLSLGSRDQAPDGALAGAPVLVPFAPQIELLKRATLAITHAGLSTALESFEKRRVATRRRSPI